MTNGAHGNLRADYMPNGNGFPTSDHRLVAVDVTPGHRD